MLFGNNFDNFDLIIIVYVIKQLLIFIIIRLLFFYQFYIDAKSESTHILMYLM